MKRIALLFLVLAVSAHYAWAGPEGGPGGEFGHGRGNPIIKMAEELNLSAEQKRTVAGILKEDREAMRTATATMHQAMEAMKAAMDKEPYSEAAVREAYKAVSAAGEILAVLHAKERAEVRAVLTPEQRQHMEKKFGEFKGKMKERFEKHHAEMDAWIAQHAN